MKNWMFVTMVGVFLVCMQAACVTASDSPVTTGQEASQTESAITWDFETGNLKGWAETGDAFKTQPTLDDNPTARKRGEPSGHQGKYWIGGYENRRLPEDPPGRIQGDEPQGSLTSTTFVIRQPVISFLIGGGCDLNTERAELLLDGAAQMKATGRCRETMERRCWDVSSLKGRIAQIRLVDASGGPWGHINFDDVRFVGEESGDVKAIMASEKCVPEGAASSKTGSGSGTTRTIRTYKTIRVR